MGATTPLNYMQRTREYYAAHGYEKPYVWAQFDDIPFTPLAKPLADSKVTIVTTSMPNSRRPTHHFIRLKVRAPRRL